MYIINMSSGCTHKEASFKSLDHLDNTFVLLDEDNNLEGKIIHSYNEVSIFIFKFGKQYNQSGSQYTQNMYRNTGQL